jgi:subtilisin family serine protease
VVVAAAGNNGATNAEYPAAESNPGLLAVAATTPQDTKAAFSNYGQWVSIGAPGEAIVSAIPGNRSGAWSGTSMAAPFAAGVAALVRAHNSQFLPGQVVQQIKSTAASVGGPVPLRIDAAAALGLGPATGLQPRLYLPTVQACTCRHSI